jgi:Flp pilus assembly protein TadD
MSFILPMLLLAQATSPIVPAPLPIPRKPTAPAQVAAPEPTRLELCLQAVDENPLSAIEAAEEWLKVSKGTATVEPNHCLGMAYNRLGRPVEAEVAFTFARDALPANELRRRASYGALAALAVLEQNDPARAEAFFAAAAAEAQSRGDARLAGDIAIDRARAQVALKQDAAAAAGLAAARLGSPANPEGWLLSATLARRQGKLAEAQGFIEQAATLAPRDPAIGLEAGVIAVLSGRDQAARRSWQSVIAVAPDSDWAKTAQGYLDQLGPAPVTAPTATPVGR